MRGRRKIRGGGSKARKGNIDISVRSVLVKKRSSKKYYTTKTTIDPRTLQKGSFSCLAQREK